MEPRSLEYIAGATSGKLRQGRPATLIHRVCTDSRQIRPGDLFVAIAGIRFDGHDYVAEAARKGATAVLVHEASAAGLEVKVPVVTVDNSRAALGRLAQHYRLDFNVPMIVVAGSNGKTTTKDLITSVLSEKFNTLASEASFNNDIGVPLTLLRLENDHQAAVLEAGTNHPGELSPLLRMIVPHRGVLTDLGQEHLEFFGDMEGVAMEEGFLAEMLPKDGTLYTSGDGDWLPGIEKRTQAPVVKVGFGKPNDWRATDLRMDLKGMTFRVEGSKPEYCQEYHIQLMGRHQVQNALLALALGVDLGLDADQVKRGLAGCPPTKMRLQIWETRGVTILDDAYNANVDSMRTALETLRELPCEGRRMAVLGDMAELGTLSRVSHGEVGKMTADLGVQALILVGEFAEHTARGATEAGLKEVYKFRRVPDAAAFVNRLMQPGDLVLLKASRSSGFERIGEVFRSEG